MPSLLHKALLPAKARWCPHAAAPRDSLTRSHVAACPVTKHAQDPVVARLKAAVEDFKEVLPLVERLANPALQVGGGAGFDCFDPVLTRL